MMEVQYSKNINIRAISSCELRSTVKLAPQGTSSWNRSGDMMEYCTTCGANFAHIPVEVGTAGGNNNHKRGRYAGHRKTN